MITDEMVEKARRSWLDLDGSSEKCWRAALEAVAPMLIAQGLREAAKIIQTSYQDATVEGDLDHTAYGFVVEELNDRAQELDPK